jgi:hypothetical protein
MSKTPFIPGALTPAQHATLLELDSHGSGGSSDQEAICELFDMGLVEVRNEDRRVGLTARGKLILAAMAIAESGNPPVGAP